MNKVAIDKSVEAICRKGCQQVSRDIHTLESGRKTDEVESLSQFERLQVLNELKSIMDVYGNSCRINREQV